MPSRSAPEIVLLSSAGTLAGIDPLLRKAGVRFARIVAVVPQALEPRRWLQHLSASRPPDTVIVTSQTAVESGVRPWLRTLKGRVGAIEFWAAGPGTAKALRSSGARQVKRAPMLGAGGIQATLRRRAPRTILYFRSDRAGSHLARRLRSFGHTVFDVVVYRLATTPVLRTRARHNLLDAHVLVATSPSVLSALRHGIDRRSFLKLVRHTRLVVLGERSQRAARGHGFRRVTVAPSTTAQRFTRYLLRELRDASS